MGMGCFNFGQSCIGSMGIVSRGGGSRGRGRVERWGGSTGGRLIRRRHVRLACLEPRSRASKQNNLLPVGNMRSWKGAISINQWENKSVDTDIVIQVYGIGHEGPVLWTHYEVIQSVYHISSYYTDVKVQYEEYLNCVRHLFWSKMVHNCINIRVQLVKFSSILEHYCYYEYTNRNSVIISICLHQIQKQVCVTYWKMSLEEQQAPDG